MLYFSSAIRRGKTLAAKLHLNEKHVKKHLSQKDRDDSLTALAFAYFIDRQDEKAWETIQEPIKRADKRNPTAHWVAGLTAFRMQKWEEAEKAFKTLAAHPKAIPTQKSAAAFWTTRVLLKTKNTEKSPPTCSRRQQPRRISFTVFWPKELWAGRSAIPGKVLLWKNRTWTPF